MHRCRVGHVWLRAITSGLHFYLIYCLTTPQQFANTYKFNLALNSGPFLSHRHKPSSHAGTKLSHTISQCSIKRVIAQNVCRCSLYFPAAITLTGVPQSHPPQWVETAVHSCALSQMPKAATTTKAEKQRHPHLSYFPTRISAILPYWPRVGRSTLKPCRNHDIARSL